MRFHFRSEKRETRSLLKRNGLMQWKNTARACAMLKTVRKTLPRLTPIVSGRMTCECGRCRGVTASQAESLQLRESDLFKTILASMDDLNVKSRLNSEYFAGEGFDRCVNLLEKYGHFEWCEEIQIILTMFRTAYQAQWQTLLWQ